MMDKRSLNKLLEEMMLEVEDKNDVEFHTYIRNTLNLYQLNLNQREVLRINLYNYWERKNEDS